MNPIDHPHGGGEGRTSGGRHPVDPLGQADQRQEDAVEQADGSVHRDEPPRTQEEGLSASWHARSGRGRSSTATCLKKAGRRARLDAERGDQDLEPPLHDPAQFVGLTFGVYNGHKHIPVYVSEEMVGPQVRRVLTDPDLQRPCADKKAKRR
jgi:hypothetical protein